MCANCNFPKSYEWYKRSFTSLPCLVFSVFLVAELVFSVQRRKNIVAFKQSDNWQSTATCALSSSVLQTAKENLSHPRNLYGILKSSCLKEKCCGFKVVIIKTLITLTDPCLPGNITQLKWNRSDTFSVCVHVQKPGWLHGSPAQEQISQWPEAMTSSEMFTHIIIYKWEIHVP